MQPDEKPASPLAFRLLDPKVSEFTYSIGILKDRRLQRPARLLYERVCSTDGIKNLQDYLLQ